MLLLGGSGFIGRAISDVLLAAGVAVTVVDRRPPPRSVLAAGADHVRADLLTDIPDLPDGDVVVLLGAGDPRPRWPWTLALDGPVATARVLRALAGRHVTLISSVEVYGTAPAPLREDTPPQLPWTPEELDAWCDEVCTLARTPCPPWRVAALCRRLAGADPTGRWTYGLAKLAQERLVASAVPPDRLTVLRLANAFGLGQERVLSRMVRRALAGRPLPVSTDTVRSFLPVRDVGRILATGVGPGVFNVGGEPVSLRVLAEAIRDLTGSSSPLALHPPIVPDSCGVVDATRLAAAGLQVVPVRDELARFVAEVRADTAPLFDPPLPVVVPPRPAAPDEVVERQQAALWTGAVKHGNRWSEELTQRLGKELDLADDRRLLVTESGTSALRLLVVAVAGPAAPGDAAVLPSFTFPATAEVLVQLGYRLRFVDVDAATWTIDPDAVAAALAAEPARLVVAVDTFGNPCDYARLLEVCHAGGATLVADSAAALGSLYRGVPVATQAAGHAFSMSFAKVLSAGGAGGAVVLPADACLDPAAGWARSQLMHELHAIVALDQLAVLEDLIRRRQRVAAVYAQTLANLPDGFAAQQVQAGDRHAFVHWVLRVPPVVDRDALQRDLLRFGVQTKPYFRALHLDPASAAGADSASLPVTERLDAEVLALPMSSELTEDDAERVALALERCL